MQANEARASQACRLRPGTFGTLQIDGCVRRLSSRNLISNGSDLLAAYSSEAQKIAHAVAQ